MAAYPARPPPRMRCPATMRAAAVPVPARAIGGKRGQAIDDDLRRGRPRDPELPPPQVTRGRRSAGGIPMTDPAPASTPTAPPRARILARIAGRRARGRASRRGDARRRLEDRAAPTPADAVAAGLDLFGENRVQEAAAKAGELPGARWHLVGPLQSNKARRALEVFDVDPAVDSVELARGSTGWPPRSGRARATRCCSRSTSTTTRPRRASSRTTLDAAIDELVELPQLEIRGLMTVGRLVDHRRGGAADVRSACGRCRSGSRP